MKSSRHIKESVKAKSKKFYTVLEKYKELYEALHKRHSSVSKLEPNEIELNKIILRPWQDIKKAIHWVKENWQKQLPLIGQPLPNHLELHAEMNIAYFIESLKNTTEVKPYIGTSRLCCTLCDIVLNKKGIEHRGCHGILFPWNSPSEEYNNLEQEIRTKQQSQKINLGSQLMHRKLSIDDFEKISLPKFWNLKVFLKATEEFEIAQPELPKFLSSSLIGEEEAKIAEQEG